MNTRYPLLCVLLLLAVFAATPALAQLPKGSGLRMTAGSTAGSANVIVDDPGNHSWSIMKSKDLKTWSPMEVVKVHNGRFQRKVLPTSFNSPAYYFRAVYNPAQQTLLSTRDTALKLPGFAANYANPMLPPAFSTALIASQDSTPTSNPTTNAAATLGRVLFYDKRLSRNQTISCASCHIQALGFSDGKRFSTGFDGRSTARNSIGLSNARWYGPKSYFWDERAATLEQQVLMPIANPIEMGFTVAEMLNRLKAEPFYNGKTASLFIDAFGDSVIDSDRVSRALAQFVRSIIATQTKYDAGVATQFANFTEQERLGRQIFNGQGRCANCHASDNFSAPFIETTPSGDPDPENPGPGVPWPAPAGGGAGGGGGGGAGGGAGGTGSGLTGATNNGLEFPYVDPGMGGITGKDTDKGKFKAPSLRNVGLTAPYMHDGRFATLEQVVEFYNSGVVVGPNLPAPLRNGTGPLRLNLTTEQKAALVAFLKTLTDTSMTTDPKLSDPFNYGD